MTFKWFSRKKQHGRISVDFASIYTYTVWAILSVGVFLSLCAYAIIVNYSATSCQASFNSYTSR